MSMNCEKINVRCYWDITHINNHSAALPSELFRYEVLGERVCIFIAPKGEAPTLEELREFMKEKGIAVYKNCQRDLKSLIEFRETQLAKFSSPS